MICRGTPWGRSLRSRPAPNPVELVSLILYDSTPNKNILQNLHFDQLEGWDWVKKDHSWYCRGVFFVVVENIYVHHHHRINVLRVASEIQHTAVLSGTHYLGQTIGHSMEANPHQFYKKKSIQIVLFRTTNGYWSSSYTEKFLYINLIAFLLSDFNYHDIS